MAQNTAGFTHTIWSDPFSGVVRPGTGAVISLQGKLGIDNNTNEGNAVSVNRKENVNIASA